MKKLLLLMLVLTGMVCTASAQKTGDNMRIYIGAYNVAGGDFWNDVKIHYWGTDLTEGNVDKTKTVTYNGKTWYLFEFPRSTYEGKLKFLCYDGSMDGSHKTQNHDNAVYKDTFYEINWNGSGQSCTLTEVNNIMYLYRIADAKSFLMNVNGSMYSITIDNMTSTSDNFTFVIADSRAYKNDCTIDWNNESRTDAKWFFWRPGQVSDDKVFDFTNVSDFGCWRNSGQTNAFNISSKPFIFDITMDLSDWNDGKISVSPYFTRTLPAAAEGYATFSSTYDVIPDASLKAVQYASAVDNSTGHITWKSFPRDGDNPGIKAGEGALLTGTAGNTYRFTPASSAVATGGNYLKAITSTTQLSQTSDGNTNFILTLVGTDVGFYKVNKNKSWCSAGTAYLAVPGVISARDFFALDGETTGIANVEINANDNFDANAPMYNLAGQRVNKSYKGVVIVNGKKMLNK